MEPAKPTRCRRQTRHPKGAPAKVCGGGPERLARPSVRVAGRKTGIQSTRLIAKPCSQTLGTQGDAHEYERFQSHPAPQKLRRERFGETPRRPRRACPETSLFSTRDAEFE